jgi:hypothetical protein
MHPGNTREYAIGIRSGGSKAHKVGVHAACRAATNDGSPRPPDKILKDQRSLIKKTTLVH